MPRARARAVFAESLGGDFPGPEHAFDELAQPALFKHPLVGFGPDAEFFDVVEIDCGRGPRLAREAVEVSDALLGQGKRNAVAQRLGNGEQVEPAPVFFGGEIPVELRCRLAARQEVVIIDGDVADAAVGKRRHHRGLPHALGQPCPLRRAAKTRAELLAELGDLAQPVAVRDRGEHGLGIACAEQLDLPALHHAREQRHVPGMLPEQVIEQGAAEMQRKTELGIAVAGFQEWPVAARMRLLQHMREIARRLMGMHAEQQRHRCAHAAPGPLARRMLPPPSGSPCPWEMGSDSAAGTGNSISRYRLASLARYSRSKLATEALGL
jgi:hypothetical protein